MLVLDMGTPVAILDLARRMTHGSWLEVKLAKRPKTISRLSSQACALARSCSRSCSFPGMCFLRYTPIMRSLDGHANLCNLDEILVELDRAVLYHDIVGALDVLQRTVEGFEPEYSTHQLPVETISILDDLEFYT